MAFARIDDKPIREKNQVYAPDCMVVIDPTLLRVPTLFSGIKEEGILILNSPVELEKQPDKNVRIAGIVNATQIALEELGRDIPNTCLLGALAATTNWVKLESITQSISEYFDGSKLDKNVRSAERGYREVKAVKWH